MPDLNDLYNQPVDLGGIPVTDFWGILKEITQEENQYQKQVIKHDFTDLEVVSSTEPYPFPTLRFFTTYDNREGSRWVAEKRSLDKVLPVDSAGKRDIQQLVGKRQHWSRLIPAKIRAPESEGSKTWTTQDIPCWQIVACDGFTSNGASSVNIFEKIAELLTEPMTDSAFYAKLMTEKSLTSIPGHSGAISAAMERKLLPQMLDLGFVKQEDDKWVKA